MNPDGTSLLKVSVCPGIHKSNVNGSACSWNGPVCPRSHHPALVCEARFIGSGLRELPQDPCWSTPDFQKWALAWASPDARTGKPQTPSERAREYVLDCLIADERVVLVVGVVVTYWSRSGGAPAQAWV